MKDGNVIPYVSKCLHLVTTIYTTIIEIMLLMSLMNCINVPTICCVSNLFNSFCMNLYSCQTWCFNNKKHLKVIHVAWRKCICRIWKLNSKTHNDLLHHINNCLPIEILLEKRCIKFIYNIIDSEHSLHSRIALYSLYNGGHHIR